MAKVAKNSSSSSRTTSTRPALTPEAREKQLIAKAVNLAEKQLDEGTASSQVITHFLKLATTRAELEKEKLRNETELLSARKKAIESSERMEVLYSNAIKAIQKYGGHSSSEEDEY